MHSSASETEHGLQIAPMLDVLFVLLLFFMVSAGMQKRETSITVPLPGMGHGVIPVRLDITPEGQVSFNGAPTDTLTDHQLPQTKARLQAVLIDAPMRPIVICPAPETRNQRVVDVLDACKAVHGRNIAFGTPES